LNQIHSNPGELNDGSSSHDVDGSIEEGNSHEAYLRVTVNDKGELVSRGDQVADYMYRSAELEDVSLWEFIAQIDKVKKRKIKHLEDLQENESSSDEEGPDIVDNLEMFTSTSFCFRSSLNYKVSTSLVMGLTGAPFGALCPKYCKSN